MLGLEVFEFNMDILTTVSAPSMSIDLWQRNFLTEPIPVLKNNLDRFIRNSYFGGATDYYKAYGTDLKYYDVNSLYPSVLLKYEYPKDYVKTHRNVDPNTINNLFGFMEVIIEIPKTTLKPFLPYKFEGRTIFPTGVLRGIYFSEEVKAILKYNPGSKLIEIPRFLEFTTCRPFVEVIKSLYNMKKNSIGAPRFIAKLHMNSLYGFYGRNPILNEFLIVKNEEIPFYLVTRIVNDIIEINDELSALMMSCNINHETLNLLNSTFNTNRTTPYLPIKTNVAIASAVTAYARIDMMPLKLDDNVLYSDTDSIITSSIISDSLIGKELGQLKDELDGKFIKECLVLGIKEYGYTYNNDNGDLVEKSVFAGVKRDSLTLNEMKRLHNGEILTVETQERLFRSFKTLNLNFKKVTLNLQRTNIKPLIDNIYQPLHIENGKVVNNMLVNNQIVNKPITVKSLNKSLIEHGSRDLKFYKNYIETNKNN